MSAFDVIRGVTAVLEKAQIPYMLTGSFASAQHGALRSTQGIDFVISATHSQLQRLIELLTGEQYYVELDAALEGHRRESLFNAIDQRSGWKIDFIFRKSRPFSNEEFARRQRAEIEGISIYVATAEDIVVAKLKWAKLGMSQRQIEDAVAVIRVQGKTLNRPYVEKWVSELDLEREWQAAKELVGPII